MAFWDFLKRKKKVTPGPGMQLPEEEEQEEKEEKVSMPAHAEPTKEQKAQAEAARKAYEIEQLRYRKEMEGLKKEMAHAKHERRKEQLQDVGKVAGGVARAFGYDKQSKKNLVAARELYLPSEKAAKRMYLSEAATSNLREATRFGGEELRRQTSLNPDVNVSRMVVPTSKSLATLRRGNDYSFLRQIQTPRGLSHLEQTIFAEVKANGDRDTRSHLVQTLKPLGFSKKEVEDGLKTLMNKKLIGKTGGFEGAEPEYEVTLHEGVMGHHG